MSVQVSGRIGKPRIFGLLILLGISEFVGKFQGNIVFHSPFTEIKSILFLRIMVSVDILFESWRMLVISPYALINYQH